MNAELSQALLRARAVIRALVRVAPAETRPGGCSLAPAGAM